MPRHPKRHPKAPPAPPAGPLPPAPAPPSRAWILAFLGALVAAVTLTYSNHFHNSFHFDDTYAIVGNPYIRDLHNAALFFKDARTECVLPANQSYRPLMVLSFAVDYWLGHGLRDTLWFHISTFFWYLVQLVLMFFLFRRVYDAARPDPRNAWAALFATALFGLHPAMAETVNYIVGRADLYSALALVASTLLYVAAPRLRRYGVYLLPAAIGIFAKQPTAMFPMILFSWIYIFEARDLRTAVVRTLPSFVVMGGMAYLVLRLNSASFSGGASSPYTYRISQPAVLLSYFRRFFLPIDLSADTDRAPYSSLRDGPVILGIVFVVLLIAAILACRRRRETGPIAFGLAWFLVSCIPTSWIPLAEVENDHRLFLPFVGLAVGVTWAAALWLYRHPLPRPVVAAACGLLLASAAWGAHQRNIIWHTDESLWLDVTKKSPGNGRGLMNYGLTQMRLGRYAVALDYFTRALVLNPYYSTLETNLGVVNGALKHNAEAEAHFRRALQLAPTGNSERYFFANWLDQNGRDPEAIRILAGSLQMKADDIDSRQLLMQIYYKLGDRERLRALATETLGIFPADPASSAWLSRASRMTQRVPAAEVQAPGKPAPENPIAAGLLNQSLAYYKEGKYPESIAAASEALKLRPDYAAAWNNIMASYNAMSDWDRAIAAGEKAVALEPGNELAQNNLALARVQKAKAARK